jgi:6-phosphogluconolactonase
MTNANVEFSRSDSPPALATQVASDIAVRLANAIALRGQASLLVSGGHSPLRLFEQLSA